MTATELLTVVETARRLRVSRRTVERLIKAGRLRPVRIGRRVLITTQELEAFLAWARRRG